MKALSELQVSMKGKPTLILFGVPDTDAEREEMFRLRFRVYRDRRYINPERFSDGLDCDRYDMEEKCAYLVAVVKGHIVGSVRLIIDTVLPTEAECFRFQEPEAIRKVPREHRGEIGRLVIVPYRDDQYLPRNLVMLFLMHVLLVVGHERDIRGGYAFIKKKLQVKLEKLKIPFHTITPFTQVYPKDGVLSRYFHQNDDPVIPIYFIRSEIEKRLAKIIGDKKMFQRINGKRFLLRKSLYNKFLQLMRVI